MPIFLHILLYLTFWISIDLDSSEVFYSSYRDGYTLLGCILIFAYIYWPIYIYNLFKKFMSNEGYEIFWKIPYFHYKKNNNWNEKYPIRYEGQVGNERYFSLKIKRDNYFFKPNFYFLSETEFDKYKELLINEDILSENDAVGFSISIRMVGHSWEHGKRPWNYKQLIKIVDFFKKRKNLESYTTNQFTLSGSHAKNLFEIFGVYFCKYYNRDFDFYETKVFGSNIDIFIFHNRKKLSDSWMINQNSIKKIDGNYKDFYIIVDNNIKFHFSKDGIEVTDENINEQNHNEL